MRYPPHHKDSTKLRVVESAAALVKKKGFAATGIDALMAEAGLTSGAFYSHFRTKSELLDAVIESELKRSIDLFAGKSSDQAIVAIEGYLSSAHLDSPQSGCAVPALAAEVARAVQSTQAVFETGIVDLMKNIAALVHDEERAWTIIAQMVGAVLIARALASQQARNALLEAVKHQVATQLMAGPDNIPGS